MSSRLGGERETPLTPAAAVERLAARQAGLIERELTVLQGSGSSISCRAGCAACCRQFVVVSPLEALAIEGYVNSAGPARQQRWAEAHARHREALARRPSLVRRLEAFHAAGGYVTPEQGDALEREYWEAQIPCPFLEEERCTIYPVRPFACREHFALTPAEVCAQDPDAVETPPTRFEFRAIAGQVGEQCYSLEDRLVPLFEVPEYVRERPQAVQRAAPLSSVIRQMEATLRRVLAWRRMLG
jgi:Fe-S-cluster containining protein